MAEIDIDNPSDQFEPVAPVLLFPGIEQPDPIMVEGSVDRGVQVFRTEYLINGISIISQDNLSVGIGGKHEAVRLSAIDAGDVRQGMRFSK